MGSEERDCLLIETRFMNKEFTFPTDVLYDKLKVDLSIVIILLPFFLSPPLPPSALP
jgi:hypothetical protein